MAFMAVALWLQQLVRRFDRSRSARVAVRALIVAVVVLGLLDETSPRLLRQYEDERAQYENDRDFVRRLEAQLPHDAMVFQLPPVPFPENGHFQRMLDYDLLRGYLQSSSLRWSYGAMRGRDAYRWQALVARMSVPEMADTLAFAGFRGIWIDRLGYADDGAALERELGQVLGAPPLVSGNGRLVFFSLKDHWSRLRQGMTREELARSRNVARQPLRVEWGPGFFQREGTPDNHVRWAKTAAEFALRNPSQSPQRVTVRMAVVGASAGTLSISSPFFNEALAIGPAPVAFTRTLVVPPGTHPVRFSCECARFEVPGDRRPLAFRIDNFRLERGGIPRS